MQNRTFFLLSQINVVYLRYITYAGQASVSGNTTVAKMYGCIGRGDMDGALQLLQKFLLTVPYCDNTNYEGHYQQMLYIIFSLLGYYVDVEVRTARGRVDMVMRTADTLYIIELSWTGRPKQP